MSVLYKDRDINLLDSVMQGIGSNGMFLFIGMAAQKLIGYAAGTPLLTGAKIQTLEKLSRYAGASIQHHKRNSRRKAQKQSPLRRIFLLEYSGNLYKYSR